MPVESADDLAVFFNADEFGVEAVYTPPGGGSTTACTVILSDADVPERSEFAGRPPMQGKLIAVRASELAAPAGGGRFAIGAQIYTVVGSPVLEEPLRTIWSCMAG